MDRRTELTDWLGVHDLEFEGGRRVHLAVHVGQEAGVHAALHLGAGLFKGGLSEGVVLLHKSKVNHVADGRRDGVGSVDGLLASNNDLEMF